MSNNVLRVSDATVKCLAAKLSSKNKPTGIPVSKVVSDKCKGCGTEALAMILSDGYCPKCHKSPLSAEIQTVERTALKHLRMVKCFVRAVSFSQKNAELRKVGDSVGNSSGGTRHFDPVERNGRQNTSNPAPQPALVKSYQYAFIVSAYTATVIESGKRKGSFEYTRIPKFIPQPVGTALAPFEVKETTTIEQLTDYSKKIFPPIIFLDQSDHNPFQLLETK
ncbi:hypothetical protein BCR33DRAFT_794933 [Rhizoclosmatium globosum]|uniref:Uncharacterized protein n=1 Tax=Rhizoclosmatium globosum TaxID=329046 RepID=A0A1Y2AVN4_9FUNG|nr:hypothetical protein BCR33DRAFT_794933 [Rhizoclosmatium globosum]|eukprot:ORY25965.1 hypothetical protein BCR33DRAFT_794933 [Rhizoclosmatium globosum]